MASREARRQATLEASSPFQIGASKSAFHLKEQVSPTPQHYGLFQEGGKSGSLTSGKRFSL